MLFLFLLFALGMSTLKAMDNLEPQSNSLSKSPQWAFDSNSLSNSHEESVLEDQRATEQENPFSRLIKNLSNKDKKYWEQKCSQNAEKALHLFLTNHDYSEDAIKKISGMEWATLKALLSQ